MIRNCLKDLENWKLLSGRKPLIVQGARQVGKTWIMKEFGKQHFENVVYINFENNIDLQSIFENNFDIQRIISIFEISSKIKINAIDTLIILDEIQEATKGLTALKYFYELAPEYYIVAAGSLLGVSLQKNNTFPVGKVDFLTLYPLNFEEFLINQNEELLINAIKNNQWNTIESFHEKSISYLRLYYFTGGMPEAVDTYLTTKDLNKVRQIQKNIISGYENDFSKYAPVQIVPKIRMVWNAILSQLAKENKKFIYGQIKKGARAKDFEEAINWLTNAGLLLRCSKISKPDIPLLSYIDYDAFKLYLLDIGLLNAMANLSEDVLLQKNKVLVEFKGALTEQYVCQELVNTHKLYYWAAENGTAEIDFVIQKNQSVVPIEVKAEENLKAKSLKVFVEKYNIDFAIRTSMSYHKKESWLENIPLYGIGFV